MLVFGIVLSILGGVLLTVFTAPAALVYSGRSRTLRTLALAEKWWRGTMIGDYALIVGLFLAGPLHMLGAFLPIVALTGAVNLLVLADLGRKLNRAMGVAHAPFLQ